MLSCIDSSSPDSLGSEGVITLGEGGLCYHTDGKLNTLLMHIDFVLT